METRWWKGTERLMLPPFSEAGLTTWFVATKKFWQGYMELIILYADWKVLAYKFGARKKFSERITEQL